jgi:hypothetical protein
MENGKGINERFNDELQRQIAGTLSKGHTYQLGRPSPILQSADIPDLPIELRASRLSDKSMQENHPFTLSEVRNLPEAIQNPMAVFRSATHIGSYVIMTEIEHEGKNYVVALEANRKQTNIEVNSIRSVHYRKSNTHIANWINEGLMNYVDKEKMIEWITKQRYNSADVRNLFNHTTKVIKDFENPKLLDTNLYHSVENHLNNIVMEKKDMKNLEMSAEILAEMAKNENPRIRMEVGSHSNTSVETLAVLAKDKDSLVRGYISYNPKISMGTLAVLAKDKDGFVRQCIAENPRTSVETLATLAKDEDEWVRMNVTKNPKTSVEILTEMVKDEDWRVRQCVAENLKTPVEALAVLAKDEDVRVRTDVWNRMNAAYNSNTSAKVVEILAELVKNNKDVRVREEFQKNKNMESTKTYVGSSYKTENDKG